ncbi:MAG: M48 family metalloprotease [Bryobacterales bacterium]|nr:M48 family metalloprotease [Bryobacterales bacterium]
MSALITSDELRTAFPERIEKPPVTNWYRFGLAAVVLTLILLQALYVVLVLAVGSATVLYTVSLPALFSKVRINWITIVMMLGPPVIGAITTFFLFKPILARAQKPPENMRLTPDEQPDLFEFVGRLCRCVGAPEPSAIDVDLQVNASAGLRRGVRSLFTNDLLLTIGLPLVQGLTLQQFAGVLAHEFGHFSQKAGIRSYFLIQSINRWFARVAYERDEWDLKLEDWRESSSSWRIKLVLWVANWSIRFSRWILQLLLKAGALVSSAFSRQMEYDADHYEATLAGADTFEETTYALPRLALASEHGWSQVNQGWQSRRLSDDFPQLVVAHFESMGEETTAALRAHTAAEQTQRFASHPSAGDRIANVRKRNPPGAVRLEGPATRLFRDFPDLCKRVTVHHYESVLGDAYQGAELLPASELIGNAAQLAEYGRARQRMFGDLSYLHRWFDVTAERQARPAKDVNVEELDAEYGNLLSRLLHREGAVALLETGTKIQPDAFQVRSSNLEMAQADADGTRPELNAVAARLAAQFQEEASGIRQSASRAQAGVFPDDAELDGATCLNAYEAICKAQPKLLDVRVYMVRMRILASNRSCIPANEWDGAFDRNTRKLDEHCRRVLREFEAVVSPVRRGSRRVTLGEQLGHDDPGSVDAEGRAAWLLEHCDMITLRILDRLCWLAQNGDGQNGDSAKE